ncbi:hypothetical protein ACT7CZ_09960 [Bacillus cereus]
MEQFLKQRYRFLLWLSIERTPKPEVFDPAAGLINPPMFVSCGVGAA